MDWVLSNHWRRMEREAKAKVVAAVWGTEWLQFHATLAVLPRSIWNKRLNSSCVKVSSFLILRANLSKLCNLWYTSLTSSHLSSRWVDIWVPDNDPPPPSRTLSRRWHDATPDIDYRVCFSKCWSHVNVSAFERFHFQRWPDFERFRWRQLVLMSSILLQMLMWRWRDINRTSTFCFERFTLRQPPMSAVVLWTWV